MNVSAIRLHIEAGPSRYLSAYLCLIHSAAAVVVWLLATGALAGFFLFAAIAASLAHGLCVHGWRCAGRSIVAADYNESGDWILYTGDGAELTGRLLPSTFCTLFLVVLNFRTGRARFRSLVLAPDAASRENLRGLRVYLRRKASARSSP